MSSQKGNVDKRKCQKYANKTAFRNDLHDTNKRTKAIRELEIVGCCDKCTKVIEWKIQYKKYKPLTQPKKCVKCEQKSVLCAYTIICQRCADSQKVCRKCGTNIENPDAGSPSEPCDVPASADNQCTSKDASKDDTRQSLSVQSSSTNISTVENSSSVASAESNQDCIRYSDSEDDDEDDDDDINDDDDDCNESEEDDN